ncbi:MAG: HzsA-related protein [Pirellulaceae bacterium]
MRNAQCKPKGRCEASAAIVLLSIGLLVWAGSTSQIVAAEGIDGIEEIVFAVRQPGDGGHWYENFGNTAFEPNKLISGSIGRLCRLNTTTGQLRILLDDPDGAVRDPQISYDARTVLFAYRPGGTDHYHLYEISVDGEQLKQLTDGPYDDIEPTYLPDSRIMFCSSRCRRYVNCWYTRVATLFACNGDGSNIHPLSSNIEHDNTPWPLPDGRVLYTRWEYVDRSRVGFHHLWTMNPDGTNQTVCFGNLHFGTLMIDAKPIPRTDDIVSIFSPGHGKREHDGAVVVLSTKKGPDERLSARTIHEAPVFRDPYPVDAERFLVASGPKIVLINAEGALQDVYRLPEELSSAGAECHEPRVLRTRPREPAIPPRVDRCASTGRLILQNVYEGRQMEGVERGEIKRLLVLETLPKPVNFSGKMPPISYGGTYTLERVLGTVPVAEDGSAYMEVPALRPLFFVALDAQGNSVQRMHSFLTVMPGETTGCVGCHERRMEPPAFASQTSGLAATSGPPHPIEPLSGIPEVFDFPRDIQPILDRHCVECHDYDRREGGVILTGDRGPIYSHSYFTLTALGYVSDGRDRQETNLPPRSVGTSASPLMKMLEGTHYESTLSAHEQDMIRYWIESAAAYPGTYAALGSGMIGGFPYSQLETSDRKWPQSIAAADALERRCASCHGEDCPLPRYLSDNLGFELSNPDFSDVRVGNSRHLMFNLTRPEKSLILLAPLGRDAGGYGICLRTSGDGTVRPVFEDAADADYGKILALCQAGRSHLERFKRFDMPGFRPDPAYVREMQRFGALPTSLDDLVPIDVYAADETYWQSFWYRPDADLKAITAR